MSSSGALGEVDFEGFRTLCRAPAVEVAEKEEEGIDHFDRLPDSVLLVIFNRIGDVKVLGRCCVVSRRFHALALLVDDVVVRVDCVISDDPSSSPGAAGGSVSDKPRGVFSHLARLVLGGLVKPLQALSQILSASSCTDATAVSAAARKSASASPSEASHHSPTEVLKNFKEVRRLRIELPDGELDVDGGVLLKWRADFGSSIESCVILGASSSSIPPRSPDPEPNPSFQDACGVDDCGSIPDSFYTDGSLKRRVVWTISSLVAASARHYLLHPIVANHETLESLDLTDADGQGVLTMDRRQLQELRTKPVTASGSSQRTLLPALSMRLWYAHQLELPGGMVLKGATLLAIRPSEERTREAVGGAGGSFGFSDGYWVSDAFEEPYRTAATMLMKRRTYSLEMNSF
ncbi:F-box protein At5g46170-like [Musa acuminata AAA Group]|uniref:F-box protein At5g46170-like n=1 Tax=Musa acuminata AAA Group TaxID=214697 RepID=UPI0031D02454